MKKKFSKCFCLLLVGIVVLAGCTDQSEKSASNKEEMKPLYDWGTVTGKTITIWGDEVELTRPYMTKAFENYNKATGNTIACTYITKEQRNSDVPKAFHTQGAERPDILFGYGGTNLDNLAAEENFYDFTDAPWISDLSDIAMSQTVYEGKVMGLPCGEASVSGTIYNKDIFRKLKIKLPETQEEFLEVCETLLDNGITPMYLPNADITMLLYQFALDSVVSEEETLNALNEGRLTYAEMPEMKKILQWYKTMADSGYFGTDYESGNWDGMDDAMKSGEYAMMLCWDTWLYTNFTGDPSDFGLMQAFVGVPEKGSFEGPNIIMLTANKNSANLDASLDFINFMADPCNYNVSREGLYSAPIFNMQTGSITTPQYMEAQALIDKHFYNSTAWLRIKGFSQLDAKYIQDYMQGKSTMEQSLDGMDKARITRGLGK